MGETFLGLNSVFWQFLNGFLATIIIGICMGLVSSKWLHKRDLLNAEEGELLNKRVDAYMDLLQFMSSLENKKIIMDPDFSLRNRLDPENIFIYRDRPAVEYWPMLENFQEFKENFIILDRFYKENLYLMDFRAAKELIHVYCMFSRIYDYYIYTSTVRMKDGNPIEQSDVEKIMGAFLPKVGIFLDWDFTVMQAKLEKKLVKGVYKPSFARNSKVASEEWCKNYGLKRYAKTHFMLAEKELFAALVMDVCENQHISQEDKIALFIPNQFVQLTEWEGLWYE